MEASDPQLRREHFSQDNPDVQRPCRASFLQQHPSQPNQAAWYERRAARVIAGRNQRRGGDQDVPDNIPVREDYSYVLCEEVQRAREKVLVGNNAYQHAANDDARITPTLCAAIPDR